MSHESSTVAVGMSVLAAMKQSAPMTESAREAMPALIEKLNGFGRTALAGELALAFENYGDGEPHGK